MTVQPGTDLVPIHQHPTAYILDHTDRCDKCGARAYVHTILEEGSLYWCRHHYLANQDALRGRVIHTVDETRALFEHIKDDRWVTEGKAQTLPPPEPNHGIKE